MLLSSWLSVAICTPEVVSGLVEAVRERCCEEQMERGETGDSEGNESDDDRNW